MFLIKNLVKKLNMFQIKKVSSASITYYNNIPMTTITFKSNFS